MTSKNTKPEPRVTCNQARRTSMENSSGVSACLVCGGPARDGSLCVPCGGTGDCEPKPGARLLLGDCVERMRELPNESAQCCVTSPPYFGLRDYGEDGQIGLEDTPSAYVKRLIGVFSEVRRVLRGDGVLLLNLGDSYAASRTYQVPQSNSTDVGNRKGSKVPPGLKPKDLIGIPWRVAFALQADGWWLRSDIIWHKPNAMPSSVKDRPTSAHEYVFLLTKSRRYTWNGDAIREPAVSTHPSGNGFKRPERISLGGRGSDDPWTPTKTRNARTVWAINTKPFRGAHYAVMALELAERCVKAGSFDGDCVFDPFGGAGTTALAALKHGRSSISCELNPVSLDIARRRLEAAE